ncbi:autotransporter outer membrane beta-barrel domain-containing protein [Pseudomonas japonica]|uniref:autotransporter outer membrane beta-barrel domain-containing protein n=1 Tax=Pseudomonas japonica TaxID=256466 RepID=UPI0015E4897F|nr:autotransporter outer membrane beta-barrel domain-containing protein [Pseudomonas japonica]MBA1242511.1 autotransporter outer membrane beta-barrel domain-containing protein [Pseudomonas japonica]
MDNRSPHLSGLGGHPYHRLQAALLLALAGPLGLAEAADSCTTAITTVSSAITVACSLSQGQSLTVTNSGAIEVPSGAAVTLTGYNHTLANSGTLSGDYGVRITAQDTALDSFANTRTGLIKGAVEGVSISHAGLGALTNAGQITGNVAMTLSDVGLTRFDNSGRIDGSEDGLVIERSIIREDFRNSGAITAFSRGLTLTNDTLLGNFVNTGRLAYTALTGTHVYGQFINEGSIASGFTSLGIGDSTIEGGLINRGVLYGGSFVGISSSVLGSLVNEGTITAGTGEFDVTDTLIKGDLINTGVMRSLYGGLPALHMYGGAILGDVINSGRIDGDYHGTGIELDRGASVFGDFINTGLILGADGAILTRAQLAGDFINRGTIRYNSYDDGYLGSALRLTDSTVRGSVTNNGLMSGRGAGITLTNSSLGGLVNTGTLAGGQYALYVDGTSTLPTLAIGGNGTARFKGAVYAPNTKAYLYSNARYNLAPGDRWTVDSFTNRGQLVLTAPVAAAKPARFTGDYIQRDGAVLRTEVTDATHYGQLVVSGTATLPSQARIDVDVASANQPFTVSRLQDVIKAGTLKSNGTFAVTSNSALFNFGAVKDANTVDLTLVAKTSSGVGVAASEAGLTGAGGAARVLDQQLALGSASALTPYFVSATSNAEVASRLAQTLPQTNASLRASQGALSAIGLAVQERMGIANGLLSADGLNNAPGLWSKPFSYASGRTGGSSGSVIGMDTRLSSTSRAGLAFAYANAETTNVQGAAQSSQLDLWQFLGYRSYALDRTTELMLYAGAGNNSVQGERTLALSGVSGTAKGDYDSVIATVGASLGRTLQLSDTTQLLPALRLDFNHIRDEAYREHGSSGLAPLLLNVEERHSNQLIAGLDGTLAHAFTPRTALKLNLGVGYDLINDDGAVKAAFAGAPDQTFTTPGEKASPWLWRSGAGLATTFSNGAELSVNYDAQTRSDYTDQTASVKFRLPF